MQVFRHYKRGTLYLLVHHAILEEGLKPVVVYQNAETGLLFVRPVEDFFGVVEFDGNLVRRFEPVEKSSSQT